MTKPVNEIPSNPIPDIDRIEQLLGQFKPFPTSRFRQKISTAPWLTHTPHRLQRRKISFDHLKSMGIAAALALIALFSVLFIPSVRVIARQVFFSFINAPGNQLEVQVDVDDPAELFHYSDASNFTQSIEQVEMASGFDIKQIAVMPVGLELVGARYDESYAAATILYQADGYKLFLTQRNVNLGKDVFSIGRDAHIDLVMVGGHQGEFVSGGWKAISTQDASSTQQDGSQVKVQAVWDNGLAQYTLRWQAEGYAYELRTVGQGSPSQAELITFANGLK